MAPSHTPIRHDVVNQSNNITLSSTPVFRPTIRRSSSLSSSPSHSSNSSFESSLSFNDIVYPNDHHLGSPLISPQFSKGVPFSWEHIPGIPKQKFSKKNSSSSLGQALLPLPPPASSGSNKKSATTSSFLDEFSPRKSSCANKVKDPFFAAFVECSKDDHDKRNANFSDIWKFTSSKVATPPTRSLSDRFGFIGMYASCKNTCTVSESIVYLPRSRNYGRD